MEKSSIIHIMNERYAYKLSDHHYVIKLITKKNDFKKITLRYVEKYLRENARFIKIPSETFSVEMKKVASTEFHDYYEASIRDTIPLLGGELEMLAARYYFVLDDGFETLFYGNYKFMNKEPYETIDMFNLVIHQANSLYFRVPSWSKGAVIYQIFPERFSPSDDKYCSSWNEVPMNWKTRTNGTIKGIEQKIPYLKELGIDAVYLTPIFLSQSSHRYDTIDYMEIDPPLGTKEEFKSLVEKLHANNIKIILDIVFNHSSTMFFAFQDLLKNQQNSIYKDWYFVEQWPVDTNFPAKYRGFSFSPYMPKLNSSNPECRKYLLNVAKHYLETFDVDGYRLDVADEVTHDFWNEFRRTCKQIKPDTLIMGEIWYDSNAYLRGDQFDSVMNYTIFDAIRGIIQGKFTIDEFINLIERERGEASLSYYHSSNILVGSHDTERIFRAVGSSPEKYKIAMALLLTLPGSPIIYYGDEKMMDGDKDPDCRRGMIFDYSYHTNEFEFIKKMISIKHLIPFKEGDLLINKKEPYFSFTRSTKTQSYKVIINFSSNEIIDESLSGKLNIINNQICSSIIEPYGIIIFENK